MKFHLIITYNLRHKSTNKFQQNQQLSGKLTSHSGFLVESIKPGFGQNSHASWRDFGGLRKKREVLGVSLRAKVDLVCLLPVLSMLLQISAAAPDRKSEMFAEIIST